MLDNGDKKVNKKNIKKFFKDRAKKHEESNPLKSVIYQDKNPALAKTRDAFEKNKIISLINISKDDVVLDIGCGIGRWAKEMSSMVKKYVGVDNVEEFINISKKTYKNNDNTHFICQDGVNLLSKKIKSHSPFTIIMTVGFFMYISDEEAYEVLNKILKISNNKSQIIIREPIAIKKELVLNNVWSDEMETRYSAIYRTRDRFKKIFSDVLYGEGYSLVIDEALYPEELNNRIETKQYLFNLKKISRQR